MARKKKEKKKDKEKEEESPGEDLDDEKIDSAESDEKETEPDAEDDGQTDDSVAEKKGEKPWGAWIRRWWIPGLIIFIFIAAGTAALLKPDLLDIVKGKNKPASSIDPANDNLQEVGLLPFFIPPSSDLSRSAVRVDLTVIWDGVASVRFKTNEPRIRAEVYDYLMKAAESSEDLNSQKAIMEEGMSVIFRKSLGVQELAIRIKELKSI